MSARILDGRALARQIAAEVRGEVEALLGQGKPRPSLAVVRVGDDPASVRYAVQLERACQGAGIGFARQALELTADDATLDGELRGLSAEPAVSGILLQFPLPKSFSQERAAAAIDPAKDVDGVNPINAGRLFQGSGDYFAPATPLGGIELLRRSGVEIAGKRAVVVGRSPIVGRPLAILLLREHATVTICHTRTPDLGAVTRQAEILAVAAGRPGLITKDMVAPGAVVLDFGINVVDGKVVGDVDFDGVSQVAAAITPVPGGTGPMTNAMLLLNTLKAARRGESKT